jgi:CubicO group peptidase (beta-lactamase class C family)
MTRRRALLLGSLTAPTAGIRAYAALPAQDTIRAILRERVEIGRQSTGIVAMAIDKTEQRLVTFGRPDTPDERPLDGDTVFEIGSITKVLTALLLADMVTRGEVMMSDPLGKYLPASVKVPDFRGTPITLLDLATYTSGLPRWPDNVWIPDSPTPYADYTVDQLYAALSAHTLRYEPGTHYEYTNWGFALLGHALANRVGLSYEDLMIERICQPLGLRSTRITLTPEMRSRMAQGHNSSLEPTPLWDLPAFAGAGAVRSTANDLLVILEACLGKRNTPLDPALALLLATRRPTGMAGVEVGLGWFILSFHGDEIVWKDGETGGFATFIGFSPGRDQGAQVLTNAGNWSGMKEIGMHLIDETYPLVRQRQQMAVDPMVLAGYTGTYFLSPSLAITVRARGSRLFAQATNQREFEAFASSNSEFFLRVVDAQITFEPVGEGKTFVLILHQNGRDQRGQRRE